MSWHQMKVTKALLEHLLFLHFSPGGIRVGIPPIYQQRPTSWETNSGLRSERGRSAKPPPKPPFQPFRSKMIHPFIFLVDLTVSHDTEGADILLTV